MRITVPTLFLATLLAACGPTAPEPAPTPAPTPAPATQPAPKPVAAAVPAKEIPQGVCGEQGALPADQRIANTARWTTASEQNNFGFDVYRGDSEHGPFAKLTKSPILGAGTSDETHKYEFRDDSIDPCREYWYYVESINTSGAREKFTPTFHAAAKRRAATAAAPAATPPAAPAGS